MVVAIEIAFVEQNIILDNQEWDGISFFNEITGITDQQKHEYLYFEFPEYGGQQAIRLGRWKGIRTDMHQSNASIALYDLKMDRLEENDVSLAHPEIVTQFDRIFESEHETSIIERFRFEILD